jgi:transposase
MKTLDPGRLIFIDESGFNTKMTRLRGRTPSGQPCIASVPHGKWESQTFIAGLRADRVDAPLLLTGAMNGRTFAAWVEQFLAPVLRTGDIVVCDNLSVHKNAEARAAIKARGAELRFLPAYSPDLNPIEMLFAKIKDHVRSAAPRCFDTICDALKAALEAVAPDECANYLKHAGYQPT